MGKVYLTIGLVVACATLLFAAMKLGGNQSVVSSNSNTESSKARAAQEKSKAASNFANLSQQPEEESVEEFIFLPGDVKIAEENVTPLNEQLELKEGTMRITNVRPVTDKEAHGEFLRPAWSPDGMQMMATRPSVGGIWIVGLNGEEPIKISDDNIFNAQWTEDGHIKITGEDGTARVYASDGVLEETTADQRLAFTQDDTIFVRPNAESAAIPLTTNDDRYYAPVPSPDGSYVVYSGLYSGLYLAPTDGSAPPVYLGEGNNPSWMNDSSGIVFDVTSDDGHYITEGDAYYVDTQVTERTNLTPDNNSIVQTPSINVGNDEIIFESDGVIFRGELDL